MTNRTFPAPDGFERQARYFKALAHPVRLKLLEALREGEACVCHLEALLGLRQAYISQQLAVLRNAGLVAERKEGLFVFYGLADPHLATVLEGSRAGLRRQVADEAAPVFILPARPAIGDCPCPHCEAALV